MKHAFCSLLSAGFLTTAALSAKDGAEPLNMAFLRALQAGDIEAVMTLYAPDAVLFPPGERQARGKEAIRFKWNSLLSANRVKEVQFKEATYMTSGNLSTGWGGVSMTLERREDAKLVTIEGRFSTVAQKRNGKWLYVFTALGELDEILTLRHYSRTPRPRRS